MERRRHREDGQSGIRAQQQGLGLARDTAREEMGMTPLRVVGTVTLSAPKMFTVYSETASRTDYVWCERQIVELRWDGYWLLARFAGVLASTSFTTGRTIGQPMHAYTQWSYAGFNPGRLSAQGFDVVVTRGTVDQVGTYGEGTTEPGSPILFYHPELSADQTPVQRSEE